MFRLIGFIISLYVAYRVFTSNFFATVLHVGVWIAIVLVVVAVSGMFAMSGSGNSGGSTRSGFGTSRDGYTSSARGSSTYDREYARQMRMQTAEMRFAQAHAASEARNEQWRREDAEEQARYDAAVRRGRQW